MTTLYQRLLADPGARRIWAAELGPYTGSGTETIFVSDKPFTSYSTDSPSGQPFMSRISAVPRFELTMFSSGRFGGKCEGGWAELKLANGDGGLDAWRTYGFDGRALTLKLGGVLSDGTALTYNDFGTVLEGTFAGDALVGITEVVLRVRDKAQVFERPVQSRLYTPPCLKGDGSATAIVTTITNPAGSMSEEAWIYPTTSSSASRYIFSSGSGAAGGARNLSFDTGGTNRISMRVRNDAGTLYTAVYTTALPIDTWSHVAGVFDSAAALIHIYVNGVLRASTAVAGTFVTTFSNLTLFRVANNSLDYFPGYVSEARLWSTARTAAQIRDNLYLTLDGTETGLVRYWPFDEGEGGSVVERVSGATHTVTSPGWVVSSWAPSHLHGKPKPLLYGSCLDVEPVLVDATATSGIILQVHDGKISAINAVYDKGQALTAGVHYSTSTSETNRGLILLTSYAPVGKITADISGDASGSGYVSSTADIIRRIATTRYSVVDPTGLDTASFTALNTANSSAVGIYVRGGDTVFNAGDPEALEKARRGAGPSGAEVLSELANGVGAYWGFTRAGLLQVGRFEAPAGAAVASYSSTQIGDEPALQATPLEPPVWRVIVGYARNWSPQGAQDLAGIISTNPTRHAFCTNEWRFSPPAQDSSIKDVHPEARTLVVLSTLQTLAAAEVEAARLLALWGVRRDMYPVPILGVLHERDVADVITITRPRLDFEAGRDGRLVGFRSIDNGILAEVFF